MKCYRSIASLGLAFSVVLGLAGPAIAQVPFKGRVDGFGAITPIDAASSAGLYSGVGNATHLGRFTLAMPHKIDTVKKVAEGTCLFVAANGDKVFATFSGKATPTTTPGILTINETAVITGGTGRFAGATGSFECQRVYNTMTLRQTGFFVGTISVGGP